MQFSNDERKSTLFWVRLGARRQLEGNDIVLNSIFSCTSHDLPKIIIRLVIPMGSNLT